MLYLFLVAKYDLSFFSLMNHYFFVLLCAETLTYILCYALLP